MASNVLVDLDLAADEMDARRKAWTENGFEFGPLTWRAWGAGGRTTSYRERRQLTRTQLAFASDEGRRKAVWCYSAVAGPTWSGGLGILEAASRPQLLISRMWLRSLCCSTHCSRTGSKHSDARPVSKRSPASTAVLSADDALGQASITRLSRLTPHGAPAANSHGPNPNRRSATLQYPQRGW